MYVRIGAYVECANPFEFTKRLEGACGKNKSLAADLWTVYQTLFLLRMQNERDVLQAIYSVYFQPFCKAASKKELKNEISYRIRRFAIENYVDERTVYRWLKRARDIFFKIHFEYFKQ